MEEEDLVDACARAIAVARVRDPQGFASRRDALAELLFAPLPLVASGISVRTASSDHGVKQAQHLCEQAPIGRPPHHYEKQVKQAQHLCEQAPISPHQDEKQHLCEEAPISRHQDKKQVKQAQHLCEQAPSKLAARKDAPAAHADQHHQAPVSGKGGRTAATAAAPPQAAAAACRTGAPSITTTPPPSTGSSSSATSYYEQKMEASKRKLRIGYEREEAAKRQHTICILRAGDVPHLQQKISPRIIKRPSNSAVASCYKGASSKMCHSFMGHCLTRAIVL